MEPGAAFAAPWACFQRKCSSTRGEFSMIRPRWPWNSEMSTSSTKIASKLGGEQRELERTNEYILTSFSDFKKYLQTQQTEMDFS